MSIFPVKIKEWYVKGQPFGAEIETLEVMLPYLTCVECGKPITWDRGWVYHSITFSGQDTAWCSDECYITCRA